MRLIDADELLADRSIQICIGAGDNICIDVADIANAPTIDAVPVVHGWWERKFLFNFCSECSFPFGIYEKYNYCPNCGAKMDGGNDG